MRTSAQRASLEVPGVAVEIEKLDGGAYRASIDITDPPGPPKDPNDGGQRSGPEGVGGPPAGSSPETPSQGDEKEPFRQCASRSVIFFGMSNVANLMGAYSAYTPVKWDESLPLWKGSVKWVAEKGIAGIATPQQYWKAMTTDPLFAHNNVLNAILMGVLSSAECLAGKTKAQALTGLATLLTSVVSQLMTTGEISLTQTALDVVFVTGPSVWRMRFGGYFDKRFFKHHGMFRPFEVGGYYLGDQFAGGLGYGVLQEWTEKGPLQKINYRFRPADWGHWAKRVLWPGQNLGPAPAPAVNIAGERR
ncbi:MAG: hypothetical protein HYR96_01360 [Deltaproteobacteria bacterium]|nr:hypothetical protein [Deltaproteobacteria bacterium]MBI3294366.1 hypothetical protein [Deltaproteobacteria bacterium]